jgi:hypothetical protein
MAKRKLPLEESGFGEDLEDDDIFEDATEFDLTPKKVRRDSNLLEENVYLKQIETLQKINKS